MRYSKISSCCYFYVDRKISGRTHANRRLTVKLWGRDLRFNEGSAFYEPGLIPAKFQIPWACMYELHLGFNEVPGFNTAVSLLYV